MTDICSIYVITNNVNEKVYVGQTWQLVKNRFAYHKAPSQKLCVKLHRAFNKYGRENFKVEVLITTDNQSSADYLETFWINTYDSITNGYNIMPGGHNQRHSEETKRKISIGNTGKIVSLETRKHISEAATGRTSKLKGKKHSAEHIEKNRQSHIGKVRSRESREKQSSTLKGVKRLPLSEEHKKNISKSLIGRVAYNKIQFTKEQIAIILLDNRVCSIIAKDHNVSVSTIYKIKVDNGTRSTRGKNKTNNTNNNLIC